MTATPGQRITPEVRQAISDCLACYSICTETLDYCVERGGTLAAAELLRRLRDCAELCRVSADFLLRGSARAVALCALAAEAAVVCAQACAAIADDALLHACQDACLRCATSCKEVTVKEETAVDWDAVGADSYPASDPPATMARG
ncbi:MAG: ferredoxin [Chloroflexota bacterium]